MAKVTFDTNVLLSALLSEKGASYQLVHLVAEGKITGYTSKTLMEEFKEIVQRDYKVSLEKAEQMVDVYLQFFKLVAPDFKLEVVKADEDDNRVIECAVYSSSNYIASWDPHLTDLVKVEGIKIQNPGKLIETLKEKHGIY
ncbi:MAG: putative toxin-antitoxin system toxin component, PIN family [Candidatus Micrarchaeota archaeon]